MPSIPANELKTRGVTAIEQALAENTEAIVSVRGKDKYVVMSFEQYSHLRTCELEATTSWRVDPNSSQFGSTT